MPAPFALPQDDVFECVVKPKVASEASLIQAKARMEVNTTEFTDVGGPNAAPKVARKNISIVQSV